MTFSDTDAVVPSYSRDGRWIYFARTRNEGSDVWKLPSTGGSPILALAEALCLEESIDGGTFYYTKATDNEMSIYSRPTAGGTETLLFREAGDVTAKHNPFVVLSDGIYYRRRFSGTAEHDLMFYSFGHRRSEFVLHFRFGYSREHISVSPDHKFLFIRKPEPQNNIMLVENFR